MEDITKVLAHIASPHAEVVGFQRSDCEGLIVNYHGVEYVVPVIPKDEFERRLPHRDEGFKLVDIAKLEHHEFEIGGEG